MKGPINLVRSNEIAGYINITSIYEWTEDKTYLVIDQISYKQKTGAILCYYNPPVHQVGNPGLDAFLEGLDKVYEKRDQLEFLILYGANDQVHAGGDLKESLNKLDATIAAKNEKEAKGASAEEIDELYSWADNRLKKGIGLHGSIRRIAEHMRVVAVCGGGTRFGGSAEIPLMADFLVGDSRSAMCFSEAMIGLIPGWSGIARSLIKAGAINVEYMAKTSKEVKAPQLRDIGIYNAVVDVSIPFPRMKKTDDRETDKRQYSEELEVHNHHTGLLLLPMGLQIATCLPGEISALQENERATLATKEDIAAEVERRKNPETYSGLWGKPLRDEKDAMSRLGRPLAPQSIKALDGLLDEYEPSSFNEIAFVEKEMKADASLYRDPRFRAGLIGTLEQKVADFRL
jgi:enoyl-CoA hydratase/carnithine racemase